MGPSGGVQDVRWLSRAVSGHTCCPLKPSSVASSEVQSLSQIQRDGGRPHAVALPWEGGCEALAVVRALLALASRVGVPCQPQAAGPEAAGQVGLLWSCPGHSPPEPRAVPSLPRHTQWEASSGLSGAGGPRGSEDCQVLREESPDGGLGPSQNVPLHWGGSWCQAAHMPGRGPRTAPKRARKPWLTLCTREPCVLDGGAAAPTRYGSTCLSLGARTEAQLLDRSGGPQGWPWSAAEGAPEQMGSCSQPPNPTEQGGLEVGHGGLQENRGSGSGTVAPSWVRCWV